MTTRCHSAISPALLVCLALLQLAACGGGSDAEAASATPVPSPTTPTEPGASPSALACPGLPAPAQILAAVNAVRAQALNCGTKAYAAAAPLAWNAALASAAQGHSDDMASLNYFSHTSRDGRQFDQRASQAGYTGGFLAENIAAGQGSLQSALNSWVGSPGHCANLMDPDYTDVALACATRSGTTYGTYWTLMAGAR
ncbi:MAG: hypothetical protein RL375_2227 [Pseudomonadota bacterium]